MERQGATYNKQERLKSKKRIEELFRKGKVIHAGPLSARFLWKNDVSESNLQAAFSVPKRNIKLAVNRNLLKRRLREAYRLNNQALKLRVSESKGLDLIVVYNTKQILSYKEIEDKIKVILTRLTESGEVVGQ
ncbi:MAG: ribonuclease P protein component [Flavobacteriales bacterium]|nr:ribonuclease P protein component [Flavobacteriales bacterium]